MSAANNQDILNRMCKQARAAWKDYVLAGNAGLDATAEIFRKRWDCAADACYSFAARNALRVRKGQVGGA